MKNLFTPSAKRVDAPFVPSIYAYVDKTPGGRFRYVSVKPGRRRPMKQSEGRTCGTWSEPGSAEHKAAFLNVQNRLKKLAALHIGVALEGKQEATGPSDIGFLEFLRQRVELDLARNSNRCQSAYRYACDIYPEKLKLRDLKRTDFHALAEHLEANVSKETARNYLAWIKGQLTRACDKFQLIDSNPWSGLSVSVGNYHTAPHKKQRMTRDELNALKQAPRNVNETFILNAFLFACATGVGRAELLELTHGHIQRKPNGSGLLKLTRCKTKQHAPMTCHIPVSASTLELCSPSVDPADLLFPELPSAVSVNNTLKRLQERVELNRPDVSFYCGRHTFVCLHIERGTKLALLKKMTGHTDTKALLRYAESLQLEEDGLELDLAM